MVIGGFGTKRWAYSRASRTGSRFHSEFTNNQLPTTSNPDQLFFRVLSSTSPVRESSAACVESSDVIPRPMTRRPPRVEPEEPDEPDALRADEPEAEPEALRELLPVPLFLDRLLLLVPDDPRPLLLRLLPEALLPLDELLFPPLALIPLRLLPVPPLLRFGMMILP